MRRTVAFVLGASFSGSSLLNALLDSQRAVRGLGEAAHLLRDDTDAWCSNCQRHVSECRLQSRVQVDRYYESLFEIYSDARVLVNSSKTIRWCFRDSPLPNSRTRVFAILISKAPHEFAYSYARHYGCDYPHAFRTWIECYREFYEEMAEALTLQGRYVDPERRRPRIRCSDLAFVRYHDLASRPSTTVGRLCRLLGVDFAPEVLSLVPTKNTCTIGGNGAVYAQQVADPEFFGPNNAYLDGKYAGRLGQIFVDDVWRRDSEFVQFSESWYERACESVRKLIHWLGHDAMPNLRRIGRGA